MKDNFKESEDMVSLTACTREDNFESGLQNDFFLLSNQNNSKVYITKMTRKIEQRISIFIK